MALDPQIQALLDRAAAAGVRPVYEMSPAEARKQIAVIPVGPEWMQPDCQTRDMVIPGPESGLPARLYRPFASEKLPLLIFFHGGGFVGGSVATHDALVRNICMSSNWAVLSVDYRLAPENRYPAAVEDCIAAAGWALSHADELGADPRRVAIGGDSAGGNLATVTALHFRDQGDPFCAQLLIYPVTDHYSSGHRSYETNASGCGLGRDGMVWYWDNYLPSADLADREDVSPLRAADLTRLPPTLIITAEHDPLCDDGELYADRLASAGVETRLSRYDGMNHGFMMWLGNVDQAEKALGEVCGWLRAAAQTERAPARQSA